MLVSYSVLLTCLLFYFLLIFVYCLFMHLTLYFFSEKVVAIISGAVTWLLCYEMPPFKNGTLIVACVYAYLFKNGAGLLLVYAYMLKCSLLLVYASIFKNGALACCVVGCAKAYAQQILQNFISARHIF
jgi:hypothetical protein